LSLERITQAGIAIADAGGIGAVSMARVAAELGFTTMSLYRHVESKEQLLTLMVDAATGPAPKSRYQDDDWRTGLTIWVRGLIEIYRTHPWILEVPITGPPLLPNQLDWMDWALAIMRSTPLAPAEQLSALLLISGYARNEVWLTSSIERGRLASGRSPQDEDERYSRALEMVVSPERMPALHALITIGLFSTTLTPEVEDDVYFFEFGLERILDGLDHHMRRHETGN
jgi:AcrR family transcriptional regulator